MAPSRNLAKGTRRGITVHGKAKETTGSSQDEHEAPESQDSDDLDVARMAQKMKESVGHALLREKRVVTS